jgi:hypothetical protein
MTSSIKKKDEIELLKRIEEQGQWLAQQTTQERVYFLEDMISNQLNVDSTTTYGLDDADNPVSGRLWLSEFSLRIASTSCNVSAWAGSRLANGMNHLLETPALFRVARFIVLTIANVTNSEETKSYSYSGWGWE